MRKKSDRDIQPDRDLKAPQSGQHERDIQALQKTNWQAELKLWSFSRDNEQIQRAIQLLQLFVAGALEAYRLKQRQKKIPANFVFPTILLSDSPDMDTFAGAFSTTGRILDHIKISVSDLRNLTKYDAAHFVEFTHEVTGEKVWRGRINDLMRDLGREEMDHVIDDQYYLRDTSEPSHQSVAEYDAHEPEYKALGTRIRLSLDQGAPEQTVNVLKKRLQKAIEHRQKSRRLK